MVRAVTAAEAEEEPQVRPVTAVRAEIMSVVLRTAAPAAAAPTEVAPAATIITTLFISAHPVMAATIDTAQVAAGHVPMARAEAEAEAGMRVLAGQAAEAWMRTTVRTVRAAVAAVAQMATAIIT